VKIDHLSGEDIIATQHVTRWHMVRTRRQQTLAEHLAVVAMFAVKLATLCKVDPSFFPALLDEALTHDAHEVEFGDMPSISKAFAMAGAAEDSMETFFWQRRGVEYSKSMSTLVKTADSLEALIFYSLEGEDKEIRAVLEAKVEKLIATLPQDAAFWVRSLVRKVQEGTFTPQPSKL